MAYAQENGETRSRHELPDVPHSNMHPHHHQPNRIQRNESAILMFFEKWFPCFGMDPMVFMNLFGPLYVVFICVALFAANAWITCPKLYGQDYCNSTLIPLGYIVVAQVALNYVAFKWYSRRNRISNLLPGKLSRADEHTSSYTRFCVPCNEVVPVKAHHCPFCKYCVMRKDHHCVVLNGCVGFGNQRYFIVFLFWTGMGALYGTVLTFQYLNQFYKPFLPFGWIDYVGPVVLKKWIFAQHCTILELALCLLFSFGIASTLASFGFSLTQLYFVVSGTTMYEFGKRRITSDDQYVAPTSLNHEAAGIRDRLLFCFGPYWLLNFALPCPWFANQLPRRYALSLQDYYLKDM